MLADAVWVPSVGCPVRRRSEAVTPRVECGIYSLLKDSCDYVRNLRQVYGQLDTLWLSLAGASDALLSQQAKRTLEYFCGLSLVGSNDALLHRAGKRTSGIFGDLWPGKRVGYPCGLSRATGSRTNIIGPV